MFLKRKFLLIIFIGFLISCVTSFLYLKKYDHTWGQNIIWSHAEILKQDLDSGKNFFSSGTEYQRTYLSSRLLGFYSHLAKYKLYENFNVPSQASELIHYGKINQGYGNLLYLIIQSLIYCFALLFFYFQILNFFNFNEQKCFFILCFLALEPTIIQWHSSFWTESIFFSLQLITLGLIIKKGKNIFHYLSIGLFIGLMYLQKTVAIFYILPVILYFLVSIKNRRIISILCCVFGYFLVLLFLGYHNFKRADIFYVTPEQSKLAHYYYIAPKVISIKNNISESEVNIEINKSVSEWTTENNINLNSEKDKRKLYNYKQKYAFKVMLSNPLITAKIYLKNIIHHGLLNPTQVFYWFKYEDPDENKGEYYKSSDHKKWIWKRLLYSSIIYFFVFTGIFHALKKKEYRYFNYFIIISIIYYMLMLGWMGNSRYFMPSLILISIFFGEGVFLIFNKLFKKNII